MDCVKDLPVDVLSKIASYKIGDPKYLKIKFCHIEALKRIQIQDFKTWSENSKTFEIKKKDLQN